MDLAKFITYPHSSLHRCFCLNKRLTPEELEEYYHHIEQELGINFHVHDQVKIDIHGCISTTYPEKFCEWGSHEVTGEHTAIIISFHNNPISINLENILRIKNNDHVLKIVDPIQYEEKLKQAHEKYKIKKGL